MIKIGRESPALPLENRSPRRKLQAGATLHLLPLPVTLGDFFVVMFFVLLDGPSGWYLVVTARGLTRVCFKKPSSFSDRLSFLLDDVYLKRNKGKGSN